MKHTNEPKIRMGESECNIDASLTSISNTSLELLNETFF